jgi:transposase-like protein
VKERARFIETDLTGLYTISELAERIGVNRQKLHQWLARHNADGMKRLVDRSLVPLRIAHRTSNEVTAARFRKLSRQRAIKTTDVERAEGSPALQ